MHCIEGRGSAGQPFFVAFWRQSKLLSLVSLDRKWLPEPFAVVLACGVALLACIPSQL
jgi:hypothetical protein